MRCSFSLFITAATFLVFSSTGADDAIVPVLNFKEEHHDDATIISGGGVYGAAASILRTTTTDHLNNIDHDLVGLVGSHYGSPADGCQPDEMEFQISGVPGAICAPECTDTPCPTDLPDGVTAEPTCALKNPATGNKYCVLLCSPSSSSTDDTTVVAMLRASSSSSSSISTSSGTVVGVGDGQCGEEATCQPVQGAGVCTYGA